MPTSREPQPAARRARAVHAVPRRADPVDRAAHHRDARQAGGQSRAPPGCADQLAARQVPRPRRREGDADVPPGVPAARAGPEEGHLGGSQAGHRRAGAARRQVTAAAAGVGVGGPVGGAPLARELELERVEAELAAELPAHLRAFARAHAAGAPAPPAPAAARRARTAALALGATAEPALAARALALLRL